MKLNEVEFKVVAGGGGSNTNASTTAGGSGGGGTTEDGVYTVIPSKRILEQNKQLRKYPLWQWNENAQHRVHWTLRLWAWLKNNLGLGLRQ